MDFAEKESYITGGRDEPFEDVVPAEHEGFPGSY